MVPPTWAGLYDQLCASPQHLRQNLFMVQSTKGSDHYADRKGEIQKHWEIFLDLAFVTPNKEQIYQCQLKDAALDREIECSVSHVWKLFYEWQLCAIPVASHNISPLQIPRGKSDSGGKNIAKEEQTLKEDLSQRTALYVAMQKLLWS